MVRNGLRYENASPLRRTLIRKTSLLHKIDPTALRSSFADVCTRARPCGCDECNGDSAPPVTHVTQGRRPDRSPLHDVRHHARPTLRSRARGFEFLTNDFCSWRRVWWSQTGSNRRPPACKAGALPTELWPRTSRCVVATEAAEQRRLVGLGRFELPTSRLSSARSNQLSYKPGTGVSNQRSVIRSTLMTEH